MKKVIISCVILVLLLVGCAPSPETIQKAIAQTQTALPTNTPTPTPTPIPLSEINLENILLFKGDLPEGYIVEPISEETTTSVTKAITGEKKRVYQAFSKEGTGNGSVTVFLFEEIEKRDQAYNLASDELYKVLDDDFSTNEHFDLKDIGEKGKLFINTHPPVRFSYLVFVRCHAFVFTGMTNDNESSSATQEYAKKLDERLTKVICR